MFPSQYFLIYEFQNFIETKLRKFLQLNESEILFTDRGIHLTKESIKKTFSQH